MMNSMKNMFRKCWSCSHQGKPESTDGADCAMPGWLLNEGHHARKLAQALRRTRSGRAAPRRRSAGPTGC